VHSLLLGCGLNLLQAAGANDLDQGTGLPGDIDFTVLGPANDSGDYRGTKLYGDFMVDCDPNGTVLSYQLLLDNLSLNAFLSPPPVTGTGRVIQPIDINGGKGITGRNIAFLMQSGGQAERRIYGWELAEMPKPEVILLRNTDRDDLGYMGAKFIQGIILEADTGGVDRTVTLLDDDGTAKVTLTVNHNGQTEKPYSFAPFVSHHIRVAPTDANSWRLFKIRWVFEPAPELTTTWQTQGTNHDLPGFQSLKDGYISLISTDVVTLSVEIDGVATTYTIPSTAGKHLKQYVLFRPLKGKMYRYLVTGTTGFRLFQKDTEIRVKPWGFQGEYQIKQPFGDTSRIAGAQI